MKCLSILQSTHLSLITPEANAPPHLTLILHRTAIKEVRKSTL